MSTDSLKPEDLFSLAIKLDEGKVLSNKLRVENKPKGIKKILIDHVVSRRESYMKNHDVRVIAQKAIDCLANRIEFTEKYLKKDKERIFNNELALGYSADIEELQKILSVINVDKQDEFISIDKIDVMFVSKDNNIKEQWELLDLQRVTERHFKKFTSSYQGTEQPTKKEFCEFIEKKIEENKGNFKDLVDLLKKDYEDFAHYSFYSQKMNRAFTTNFLKSLSKQDVGFVQINLEKLFEEDLKALSKRIEKIAYEAGVSKEWGRLGWIL